MDGSVIGLVVLVAIAVAIVYILRKSIVMVRGDRTMVVERRGKYHRTLTSGLHMIAPFIDRVQAHANQREQVVTIQTQTLATSDGGQVTIEPSNVSYAIVDPHDTDTADPTVVEELEAAVTTALDQLASSMSEAQFYTVSHQLPARLTELLNESAPRWGVRVTSVQLGHIRVP
ncbi:SPFH domain-containing protein [Natronoglycomyces albus]|uniref:Band 7 domain-containing protein n=1 Tax=Natronoglycomyces albus TaxID=2811108 RepID=A0A895XSK8_9ACTN|nr:SPFH domain-containing protein [Natronoglycomyces albus]QSB06652.1 hypothetical protein JQS30_07085 [Natronoglycomyces albus]